MSRQHKPRLHTAVLGVILHRLTAWWHRTTDQHRAAGEEWYAVARTTIRAMALRHGVSEAIAAGVVAATSPRLPWARNLTVSDEILAGRVPSGVLPRSLERARHILARTGPPLRILRGPKVRAFYRALRGDPSAPVVDVWMLRAAGVGTKSPTPRLYAIISGALERLAVIVRMPVTALQATIWIAARGRAS